MDALTKSILETIVNKGADLARDLIVDGVELVLDRVNGRVSDRAILEWLRSAQAGEDSL